MQPVSLDFVITLILLQPPGWQPLKWFMGPDAVMRCYMYANDYNAQLPERRRGMVMASYACRCRHYGEGS